MSVIVPTYEYADRLEVTVRALLADPGATEVIVVVDGCRDGSMEVLEALATEDGRVVPLFVDHVGKSGAQAAALGRATGEVVLLVDQDVIAGPGLASKHAAYHAAHHVAGRADGRGDGDHLVVLGYMPTVPDKADGQVRLLTAMYGAEYEAHCAALEADPGLVLRQLWGGNVSLRRDDCIKVGVDFRYFGHEDQDFGLRCLKAGLTGRFDRALYAEHHHARNAAQFLWYSKMQGASRWQIHQEHGDVLGPFEPDETLDGLAAPVRRLAAVLATPRLGDPSAAVLATFGDLCARLGWARAESAAYRLARRVELRTGAVLARSGQEELLRRRVGPLFGRLRPGAAR